MKLGEMGNTKRTILKALKYGELEKRFKAKDLVKLGIKKSTASTFLSKHSEFFNRISEGLYEVKNKYLNQPTTID